MSTAIQWKGMNECRTLLAQMQEKVDDPSDIFHFVGAELVTSTQDRITDEKQTPEGDFWVANSEKYAKKKAKISSGGLLELTGALVKSMTYNASATEVIVGSNMEYARRHHFGDVGADGIPSRKYLGISKTDTTVITNHIKKILADD